MYVYRPFGLHNQRSSYAFCTFPQGTKVLDSPTPIVNLGRQVVMSPHSLRKGAKEFTSPAAFPLKTVQVRLMLPQSATHEVLASAARISPKGTHQTSEPCHAPIWAAVPRLQCIGSIMVADAQWC